MKDTKGKPQLNLITYPILEGVANVRAYGIEKYKDPDSWKTIDSEHYYGAALRHINKSNCGEKYDSESGLSNLAHAACNIMFLLERETQENKKINKPSIIATDKLKNRIREVMTRLGVVLFPDPALENLIRARIKKPTGDIYKDEIQDIHKLKYIGSTNPKLYSLSGLEHLVNLGFVDFSYNNITDITPLINNRSLVAGDHVILFGNTIPKEQINKLLSRCITVEYSKEK